MKKFLYMIFMLLLLSPISIYAEELDNEELVTEKQTPKIEVVTLEKCVDGDTAQFRTNTNDIIKARFLAVDTPETVHPTKGTEPFGKEASDYTCTTLTNAKKIKLEYDLNSKEEDSYGRKLVWVFVDDVLLQESLVSQGYAEVAYLYGNYKYTALLQDSEAVAKVNQLGIWSIDEEITTTPDDSKQDIQKETKKKGFLDSLIDSLLGAIADFIDDMLESLLKSIEDML